MIAIINYGSGNIQAIANIYGRLDVPFRIVEGPSDLDGCDRAILPGVGAFDQAMAELNSSGMRQALDRWTLVDRRPILGICVGMQLLAHSSEEGTEAGLGWIDARVRRFDPAVVGNVRLPHLGWNAIDPKPDEPLFEGIDAPQGFYFLHSYYVECLDPADQAATTTYGSPFSCAVRRANVWGVQFHPEKSHHNGVRLLTNFARF